MSQKLHYLAPAAETYEVLPEGNVLTFSNGSKNEKFGVSSTNYKDDDFDE